MSEAMSLSAQNISASLNIGLRNNYLAPKQPLGLFTEAVHSTAITATSVGVTGEYAALRQLGELLGQLWGEQPQFRNIDEVYNYVVGSGNAESDDMISVCDVVGSEFCIASDDGYKLYSAIRLALLKGKTVYISFKDIKNLSAAFLDAAIGQLCNGEFSSEDISEKISLIEISPERLFLVRRAIKEAKEFYRDPERFRVAMKRIAAEGELD